MEKLQQVVTWRIVTELLRRYDDNGRLLVWQLHPGGGQYDCLSIFLCKGGQTTEQDAISNGHICDFNMAGGRFHLFNSVATACANEKKQMNESYDYMRAYLAAGDSKEVVDTIALKIGFPLNAKSSTTTPRILAFRLLAELLERFAFKREQLEICNAWHDSSGYEGSFVRQELLALPHLADRLGKLRGGWLEHALVATKYWLIYYDACMSESDGRKLIGIMDCEAAKLHCWPVGKYTVTDCWQLYQAADRDFLRTVNQLHEVVMRLK